jgi:hypothetical protein
MSMLSSGSPRPHPTQTVSGSIALLLQPDAACCAISPDSGALLGLRAAFMQWSDLGAAAGSSAKRWLETRIDSWRLVETFATFLFEVGGLFHKTGMPGWQIW